jgi:class 3 adenylate cyclase
MVPASRVIIRRNLPSLAKRAETPRMSRRRAGNVLATVVFTDIVDSSAIATELGDRRWRALLSRHHAIVRRALKRYRGREVDNAGDGFLAAFEDQVRAIRCACKISDDVRYLGIEVRAGCHVGQAEILGRKLGGITVHAGARVMAEAEPGEVLVSGVLRELVPASGFTFTDRGVHRLKGIEGEWHLFAVSSVDGDPRSPPLEPREAVHRREAIQPPKLAERRWGRVAIASSVLVLAIAAALLIAGRPKPIDIQPDSLVRIDPTTDEVVASVAVIDPNGQLTIVPPHQVWVLSEPNEVISIVDASTMRTMAPVAVAGGTGGDAAGFGLVYAFKRVWVTAFNSVETLDPDTHFHGSNLRINGGPALLTARFGRVWVMVHDAELAVGIDPEDLRVVVRAKTGSGGNGIGAGEGSVWVSNCSDGTVSKIDPTTGKASAIYLGGPACTATVGIGFGSAWAADPQSGDVYRIDPATNKVTRIHVGRGSVGFASDIAAFDGSMWMTCPGSRTVVRIDPLTNTVKDAIRLPWPPVALTVGLGSVWVATSRHVE